MASMLCNSQVCSIAPHHLLDLHLKLVDGSALRTTDSLLLWLSWASHTQTTVGHSEQLAHLVSIWPLWLELHIFPRAGRTPACINSNAVVAGSQSQRTGTASKSCARLCKRKSMALPTRVSWKSCWQSWTFASGSRIPSMSGGLSSSGEDSCSGPLSRLQLSGRQSKGKTTLLLQQIPLRGTNALCKGQTS